MYSSGKNGCQFRCSICWWSADQKLVLSRGQGHLRSTRTTNTGLPVTRHFTSHGHSTEDILVSAIWSGFQSTLDRRRFEAKLIFKHRTLHPGGLNTDFHFI